MYVQFFIGRELNPSIGSFDLKSFNELRPGLILWAVIDISMACEQAVRRGGNITDSMALVLLFQILYVADGLYNEVCLPFQLFCVMQCEGPQPSLIARNSHDNGYNNGRFRFHACSG